MKDQSKGAVTKKLFFTKRTEVTVGCKTKKLRSHPDITLSLCIQQLDNVEEIEYLLAWV